MSLDDEQVKYADEQGQLVKFSVHLLTSMKTYAIWVPAWESFKFLKRRVFKASLYDGTYASNLHCFQIKMLEKAPGVTISENEVIAEQVNHGLSDACMFHYGFVPGDVYKLKFMLISVTANKHLQRSMLEEAKARQAILTIADTSLAEDKMLRDYQLLARNDVSVQNDLYATVLHAHPPNPKNLATKNERKREANNDSVGEPLSPEKKFKNNVRRYGDKWSPERVKAFVVGLTCLVCMDWLEKSGPMGPQKVNVGSIGSYCTTLLSGEKKSFPYLAKALIKNVDKLYDRITLCMGSFPAYKDDKTHKPLFRQVVTSKRHKEKWEVDGQDLKDKWKNIVRYFDKDTCLPLTTLENCRTLTLDDYDREMITNALLILSHKWMDVKTFELFREQLKTKFAEIMEQLNDDIRMELERQRPKVVIDQDTPSDADEEQEEEGRPRAQPKQQPKKHSKQEPKQHQPKQRSKQQPKSPMHLPNIRDFSSLLNDHIAHPYHPQHPYKG